MSEIIQTYNGVTDEDDEKYRFQQTLTVAIIMALNIMELLCYVAIFTDRYTNDKSMKGILSNDTVRWRMRGNTINLSTQVIMFGMEILLMILLAIRTFYERENNATTSTTSIVNVTVVSQATLLSIVQIFASPELRRHYFTTLY